MNWLQDTLLVFGMTGIGAGLAFYDWRIASVALGTIMIILAVLPSISNR